MFRSFTYLDVDALTQYSSQIIQRKTMQIASSKASVSAHFGPAKASFELQGKENPEDSDSYLLFDAFEKELESLSGDRYFDFLNGDDYDPMTLPPMSIIRFRGFATVPDSFDVMNTFSNFAPMMIRAGLLNADEGNVPEGVLLQLLSGEKARIPLLIEGLDIAVFARLQTNFLLDDDISMMEDLEDEESVYLCKVGSYSMRDKVVVYDPLKDFMKLGRSIRRSMNRTKELEQIEVPGPILRAELIAIYH